MFVGYLKNGYENFLEKIKSNDILFDEDLLKNTHASFPQYCFGAYEDKNLAGLVSGYELEKQIYINVLHVNEKDTLKRLISLFLNNIGDMSVMVLVENQFVSTFEEFGFISYCDIHRFMHSSEAVAFNFSNSTARQINGENYSEVSNRLEKSVFSEEMGQYIANCCTFSNSLKLSTEHGFLHSYVVNKRYIKISPFLIDSGAFLDAEKLLRGVLYYRGLKKIYAYVPACQKEIVDLYSSYKFRVDGHFKLMYFKTKPDIKLENIYGL